MARRSLPLQQSQSMSEQMSHCGSTTQALTTATVPQHSGSSHQVTQNGIITQELPNPMATPEYLESSLTNVPGAQTSQTSRTTQNQIKAGTQTYNIIL